MHNIELDAMQILKMHQMDNHLYKGADTLDRMIKSGEYHQLPVVHAYLAIEMGLFNADFLRMMRIQLAALGLQTHPL